MKKIDDTIKLIDEKTGELLLEVKVGDKYHQLLLEVGLNAVLERVLEYDIFWESELEQAVGDNPWKSKLDDEEE
jgi:hypothetical protein